MCLCSLVGSVEAHAADLSLVLARSYDLEAAGEVRAALDALLPWQASFPQDYALVLRVGWLAFSVEEWEVAQAAYAQAHELSPRALEPLLGLGWTGLRRGDPEGGEVLTTLQALAPGDERVAELQAAYDAQAPLRRLTLAGVLLPGVDGDTAWGGRVRYDAGGRAVAGVAVQALLFPDSSGWGSGSSGAAAARQGPGGAAGQADGAAWSAGPGGSSSSMLAEVDLWGRAGLARPSWGAEAVGALLLHTAAEGAPGWVAGGIGRWSCVGTVRAEVSWTQPRWEEPGVGRVGASWWLPAGALALQPAGAVQLDEGALRPSAGATVWLDPEPWALWVGGGAGTVRHPTLLTQLTTLTWSAPVAGSIWGGARVGASRRSWWAVAWSTDWLRSLTTPSDLTARHSLVVTSSLRLP